MGSGEFAGCGRHSRGRGVPGWLVAIVVALTVAGGIPAGVWAEGGAAVAAVPLNLRSEPGTWAPVIGQLAQGERLALLAGPTSDDWYHVQAGDQIGWAYGTLLALDGETPPFSGGGLGGVPPPSDDDAAPQWEEAREAAEVGEESESFVKEAPAAVGGVERWVDVDRTTQTVTLFEGDVALASYWAAMGSDPSDDGFFATAVGTYYVYEKIGDLHWTDWGGAWVGNWVGFDPNRLNGFHTYSMDAGGQVIPGGDGPTGGCVALAPTAADHLFAFVAVGTRVEVHR